MRAAAERIASVILAAAIAIALAIVLVQWVDHSLSELQSAALLAAPVGGWWTGAVRRMHLVLLNRELSFTLDEIAWLEEDLAEVLPRELDRNRRHARLLKARIAELEAQR